MRPFFCAFDARSYNGQAASGFQHGKTHMPYVARDGEGKIIGVFARAATNATEEIPADSAELKAFLESSTTTSPEALREILAQSDLGMARLVEDLIDLLIDKGIIKFTDLPPAASVKYLQRQVARERLNSVNNLIVDEKDII